MVRAFAILLFCLAAAACSQAPEAPPTPVEDPAIAQDPVIARALNDPLMSDPDLASLNEANAAIGFADSDALPVLRASSVDAQAAREALRLELLGTGPITKLPEPQEGKGGEPLGPMSGAPELLAAVGAPGGCAKHLREDFAIAAALPPVAAIPPDAMVMQAGKANASGCRIHIIRYRSAAPSGDLLQYHLTRAIRAGLGAKRYALPADILVASNRGGERLTVHVVPAPHGLNGVTLVYRAPEGPSPAPAKTRKSAPAQARSPVPVKAAAPR